MSAPQSPEASALIAVEAILENKRVNSTLPIPEVTAALVKHLRDASACPSYKGSIVMEHVGSDLDDPGFNPKPIRVVDLHHRLVRRENIINLSQGSADSPLDFPAVISDPKLLRKALRRPEEIATYWNSRLLGILEPQRP